MVTSPISRILSRRVKSDSSSACYGENFNYNMKFNDLSNYMVFKEVKQLIPVESMKALKKTN